MLAFCNDLGNFGRLFLLSRALRPQRSHFCGLISFLDHATSFRQIQFADRVTLDAPWAGSRNLGRYRSFDVVEPRTAEEVAAAVPTGGRCEREWSVNYSGLMARQVLFLRGADFEIHPPAI